MVRQLVRDTAEHAAHAPSRSTSANGFRERGIAQSPLMVAAQLTLSTMGLDDFEPIVVIRQVVEAHRRNRR